MASIPAKCCYCSGVIEDTSVSCLVCEEPFHNVCKEKSKGSFSGNSYFLCFKCNSEYIGDIRKFLESNTVGEETKNIVTLLMRIIKSKDDIITNKNYYINILQNKINKLNVQLEKPPAKPMDPNPTY